VDDQQAFTELLHPSLTETYVRDAFIYDLYDGDTVYFHTNLGFSHWAAFQTGRLLDVWAAEVRPLVSRADGLVAKEYLDGLLGKYALNRHDPESLEIGRRLKIQTIRAPNKWFRGIPVEKKGKYGRWLITIIGADDSGLPYNLNEAMVEAGMAKSTRDA